MTSRSWVLLSVLSLSACAGHHAEGVDAELVEDAGSAVDGSDPACSPCRAYVTRSSCRADERCTAVPYHGESIVPCEYDTRGFSTNCPFIGCRSRTTECTPYAELECERGCGGLLPLDAAGCLHCGNCGEDWVLFTDCSAAALCAEKPLEPACSGELEGPILEFP